MERLPGTSRFDGASMKVAVIGATGFVGSNLLDHLLAGEGWEIRILSRDAERARSSLPAGVSVYQWDPIGRRSA